MQCVNCLREVQVASQHYDEEQRCWQCRRYVSPEQRMQTMRQMPTAQLERVLNNPLMDDARKAEIRLVLEERNGDVVSDDNDIPKDYRLLALRLLSDEQLKKVLDDPKVKEARKDEVRQEIERRAKQ